MDGLREGGRERDGGREREREKERNKPIEGHENRMTYRFASITYASIQIAMTRATLPPPAAACLQEVSDSALI